MVSKVILVGTISNAEKRVEKDFSRVYNSLHFFDEIDVFLVESDSSDSTIDVLNKLSKKIPNFNYVSLGELKTQLPNRIERIRKCRNVYVEHIRNSFDLKGWNYVVVADLDGMNSALKRNSFLKIFSSQTSWDACFANQKYGYYDVYALRHESWMPNDCFEELTELKNTIPKNVFTKFQFLLKIKTILAYDRARKVSIYDKMRVIKRKSPWIKVESAFGGLSIYNVSLFLKYDYSKVITEGPLISEHVDFHLKCAQDSANFYIVPHLINNNWNEYNLRKIFLVRQLSMLRGVISKKKRKAL